MDMLDDMKVHVRLKLSALWATIMFCYIYGDFWGLYTPGTVKDILAGIGPIGATSQETLVAVSVLVAVPAVLIFLSLVLPPKLSRWLNVIIAAALTIFIAITITMPGAWAFYIFMSVVEMALQVVIVWYAWSWPKQRLEPALA